MAFALPFIRIVSEYSMVDVLFLGFYVDICFCQRKPVPFQVIIQVIAKQIQQKVMIFING